MKSQVEKIRHQLVIEPYDDVYSFHFASKEMTNTLYDVFLKAFDVTDLEIPELNSKKINLLKNWVESKYEESVRLIKFPSFCDFYLNIFYRENGLRYNNIESNILVLESGLQQGIDFIVIIQEYELKLKSKEWWSEYDSILYSELQQKRMIVKDFEAYILNFELRMDIVLSSEREFIVEKCNQVCKDCIDMIKVEIAQIKLFKGEIEKIPMLENLIEYFSAVGFNSNDYSYLLEDMNNSKDNVDIEYVPINPQDQEKFVFCSKFGLMEYFKEKIIDTGVSYSDSKLYPLISLITGNNIASVRRLMSFHKSPHNSGKGNPFKDPKLMERVSRFMIINNFIKIGD